VDVDMEDGIEGHVAHGGAIPTEDMDDDAQ
jgi:hypothetical protein